MLKEEHNLNTNLFDDDVEMAYTRTGYGHGLKEVGEKDERVVAVCADLMESTRTHFFAEEFPDRYIEVGVAEQNLATVGSGLAAYGKIPFISSYAAFNPGRNNEQIRTTIALNDVPVKIYGGHAGVSVGPDGATHQALEDMALMRVQPNMIVLAPCDYEETRKMIHAIYDNDKPTYFRAARAKTPVITTEDTPFEVGKAELFWESSDPEVAIIACGPLVHKALVAAKELADEGIQTNVLNNHTIKPMDEQAVIREAKRAGAVVTVEEHQVMGGMGGAVAEILSQNHPVPQEFIGMHDRFGESGDPHELIDHFGMGSESIKQAVKRVKGRK